MFCKWGEGGGCKGRPPSRLFLMDHRFSVARDLQVGFNEIFALSAHGVSCSKWGDGTCKASK